MFIPHSFLQAADLTSTTRLVKAAVQHCYDARNYTLLNSTVNLLSKKHGQLKAAVQAIVEQVSGWLDNVKERDGDEKWLELVETLRGVTEGKVCPRYRISFFDSLKTNIIDLFGNTESARHASSRTLP